MLSSSSESTGSEPWGQMALSGSYPHQNFFLFLGTRDTSVNETKQRTKDHNQN